MKPSLTFEELTSTSLARSAKWHEKESPWTKSDWDVATTGEVGEFAEAVLDMALLALSIAGKKGEISNMLKKLRRVETGAPNLSGDPTRLIDSVSVARDKIGREMGDFLLYTVVFAHFMGVDLEHYVKLVFNEKSEEYGFPERL